MYRMKTRQDFREWAVFIHDYISAFADQIPPEIQQRLDYSPESLDVVESWLLEKFPDVMALVQTDTEGVFDGCVCYVGQTFRQNLEAKWTINVDDPDGQYYQLPVVRNLQDTLIPTVSPLHVVMKALEKRAGWYMRVMLLAYKNKGDLSELEKNPPL